MAKKVIAKTEIKPDYSRYLYVCGRNKETGYLEVIQVDKSARSQAKK